jgi:hypothetical protein
MMGYRWLILYGASDIPWGSTEGQHWGAALKGPPALRGSTEGSQHWGSLRIFLIIEGQHWRLSALRGSTEGSQHWGALSTVEPSAQRGSTEDFSYYWGAALRGSTEGPQHWGTLTEGHWGPSALRALSTKGPSALKGPQHRGAAQRIYLIIGGAAPVLIMKCAPVLIIKCVPVQINKSAPVQIFNCAPVLIIKESD